MYGRGRTTRVRRSPPPLRLAPIPVRRSNAAVPVAVALLLVGLYLGTISVLLPALLGIVLLGAGVSFLSTRVNPLSTGFYQTTKPSWTAIATVLLVGVLLFAVAYAEFARGLGPLVPGVRSLP